MYSTQKPLSFALHKCIYYYFSRGETKHSVKCRTYLFTNTPTLSLFTGVYFEKVLKGADTSLWIRNVQMYLFGIVSGIFAICTKDGQNVYDNGLLYGYNIYVYLVIGKF